MVARAGGAFGGLAEAALQNAVGYGVGTPIGAALVPIVQPITNEFWRLRPSMPLPADVAAQVAVKLPALFQQMQAEAQNLGFDNRAFAAFVDAVNQPPGIGEMLELFRRHEINEGDLIAGFRAALIEDKWLPLLPRLAKVLLSPADLAMARQQSFIDEGQQKARSELQGVDSDDAELLFKLAGEPPGPETMVALWRRGLIDEARVAQSVVESRIKLKYVPDILKLRYKPLSAATAAEAVLRERHLPKAPHYYAAAEGIDPADFDAWADLMGRPIPVGEALTLARRGEFTKAQFREAVARSDVRTEYADDLWKLREVLPTPLELRRMIAVGAVTDELATDIMVKRGYQPEIAAGIVRAAHTEKADKQRDLALGVVLDLVESGFETRDWGLGKLTDLGYDETEAQMELDVSEARRLIAYLKAAVNRVKASYVNHKIDESTALDFLAGLEVTTQQSQAYMELWDEERAANVRRLTDAQIGKAYKLGLIDETDAVNRWIQNGYPENDALVLAALAVHPAAAAPSPTSTAG